MDQSAVEKWLADNLRNAQCALGLETWRIETTVAHEPNASARAHTDPAYERARLYFDAEQFNEADLAEVLEHELLHVVGAPFRDFLELVFRAVGEGELKDTLNEAYLQACERVVRQMEKTLASVRKAHAALHLADPPDFTEGKQS